jgi:putative endonuclease
VFSLLRRWLAPPAPGDAGGAGERAAAEWLRRERRFQIVARNWRNPRDRREEIDLVARDGDILVFVEVKTRAPDAFVPGVHAVDRRKRRVLSRAIRAYLAGLPVKPVTFRLDVVEVEATAGDAAVTVRHFENIPLFSKYTRA